MNINYFQKEEIRKGIENRHYYLKIARRSMQANHIGDIHVFSSLAEKEQAKLDELTKWYDIQSLTLKNIF